jgi:hypothetical protein
MRETSASKPLMTHRNLYVTSKLGPCPCSRKSVAETYLLAMWCPVYRRRDSHSGSRMELENLAGDAKGKGASGGPARPKVPMHRPGADCSVVVMKRGNARGAKGAGHRRRSGPTGNRMSPNSWRKAAAFVRWHEPDDARVSKGLGVKFPGPTRQTATCLRMDEIAVRFLYRGSARFNDDRRDADHKRWHGRLRLPLTFRFLLPNLGMSLANLKRLGI